MFRKKENGYLTDTAAKMISEDFRKQARVKLAGKWGKAILILVVYMLFNWLIGFIGGIIDNETLNSILSLCQLVINTPLSYGLLNSFIKLFNNEEVSAFDFLSAGFNNFGRSWGIAIYTFFKLLLPMILMIIAFFMILGGFIGSILPLAQQHVDIARTISTTGISSINSSALSISLIGFILLIISSILMTTWSYYYKIANIVAIDDIDLTPKEAVNKSKEYMTGNRWKLFCLEFSFIGWAILAIFTLGIGYLWLIPYIQIAEIAFARFVCGKNEEDTPIENTENN